MEQIMEHFGLGFLYMAAGAVVAGLIAVSMKDGGILYMAVAAYIQGICG